MSKLCLMLTKLLVLICILFSFTIQAKQQSLRVAVASNFASIAKQLAQDFEQEHQVKIHWITGATGTLYQQIRHGAPYDVIFAADKLRPQTLADNGKLLDQSLLPYAIGQLSLYSAKYPNMSNQELIHQLPNFDRVAIANPDTAPYGKAAKQWLVTNGLWSKLEGKTVVGINVGQTFLQVRSKGADIGFVASSQLIATGIKERPVTLKDVQQLTQYAGVLKGSKQAKLALALINYFRQPSTQNKLANLGYLPVV
ncbi:molybdate ABC transporter substrate-binding protein [Thalassotalea sp. M1531]|uniref:Molybdate ABC transporter substrate-binding protein n=1 Tax=Thalassotalea algicola TaxID=2716224 RepID=A0A7Y0Q6L4_9GAMM|nr:molybdate ABC transporter substrate-binding protein [Thalassotalea algicola]NMP32134.1 molybdate ABC transporter substrate-binding protein [Thalassotalea algicola]